MFSSLLRLASKTSTGRHRNTSASAAVTGSTAVITQSHAKKSTLSATDATGAGSVRLAFKTENLAKLASKELPKIVNVLDIDHTQGNAAAILKLVLSQKDGIAHVANENKSLHHPLLVLVKTSLPEEEAEISEVVLGGALPQREGFRDARVIVLPSNLSAKVRSVLREHKGRMFSAAVIVKEEAKEKELDNAKEKETVVSKKTGQKELDNAKEKETVVSNKTGQKELDNAKERETVVSKKTGQKEIDNAKEKETVVSNKTGQKELDNAKERETVVSKKTGQKEIDNAKEKDANPGTITASGEEMDAKPNNEEKKEETGPVAEEQVTTAGKRGGRKATNRSEAIETEKTLPSPPQHSVLNRDETREALHVMFRSSLDAPFQPPQQMEKELFSGRVDRVRLADMLTLPLYGEGDVNVLYYRLTGAGACRTPLVAITEIMSELQLKQRVSDAKVSAKVPKKIIFGGAPESAAEAAKKTKQAPVPVPLLLLVSAPFLVGEDARLLCQEYQKTLQAALSPAGGVTVVIAPHCFTEKDVFFALRASRIDDGTESDSQKDTHEGMWCGDGSLLRRGRAGIQHHMHSAPPRNTLSEEVLKDIVSSAVEEVALRHEKSTDHLVSTLSKLVAYWSRDRVIELMETLHGERDAMLDATKQFDDVVQKLSDTRNTLKSLQSEVKVMSNTVKNQTSESNSRESKKSSDVVKALGSLESRLSQALSDVPNRKQFSHDVRKEVVEIQKTIHKDIDTAIIQHLTPMQDEHQKAIISEVKQIDKSSREELQAFRQLPDQVIAAVERASNSFSQQTSINAEKLTTEQRELIASQLARLQEEVRDIVVSGQTRVQDALKELLTAMTEKAAIDAGKPAPAGSGDVQNKSTTGEI